MKRFKRSLVQELIDDLIRTPKANLARNGEILIPFGTLAVIVVGRFTGLIPKSYLGSEPILYVMALTSALSACIALFKLCQHWMNVRRIRSHDNGKSKFEFLKRYSPEYIGELFQFFLPQKIRRECFEPTFEEIKEDRIKKAVTAKSARSRFIVESGFLFRLLVAFAASLICWFREVFPLGEIIRTIFRSGGR